MRHRHASGRLALLIAITALLALPGPARADHLTGGAPDIMGLYGGLAFLLGFPGILLSLGLGPRRWQWGRKLGWGLMGVGLLVLAVGAYQTALVPSAEAQLGGEVFGIAATRQIFGTLVAFGLASGLAMLIARRSGVLARGEAVKYVVFRDGDPGAETATLPHDARQDRIALVPLIVMGMVALLFTIGVLMAIQPWNVDAMEALRREYASGHYCGWH